MKNSSTDLIQKSVKKCFNSLTAIFPAWNQAVMGNVEEWSKEYQRQLLSAFVESGVDTQEKINKGLSKARKVNKPWLPGPGEFASWCALGPEDFGLPTVHMAFEDARMQIGKPAQWRKWKHEIVFFAAVDIGFFELKNLKDGDTTFKEIKNRFSEIYQNYVDRVIAGEEFSLPEHQRLEHKKVDLKNPLYKRAADKALRKVLAMLDE